jgi:hypothetical protein
MTRKDKRNKICLEFIKIDIQGTSKAKRDRDRRDNLGNQSIQIVETWLGYSEVLFANSEDRFIINLKRMVHYSGLT